jgi:adenylate/guanylate cyclase family protein
VRRPRPPRIGDPVAGPASLWVGIHHGLLVLGDGAINDEMGEAVGAVLGTADTMLLGRKTYDDHAGAWPEREAEGGEDAEFAKLLGDARKIVVSHQRLELSWRNSEQLQGGDYFGRTVNLAARIAARADVGQVLVSQRVAESAPPEGVTFVELGELPLKGFAHPVRLLEALPSGNI